MTKKNYTACNQNLMVHVLQAPSAQPAIYSNWDGLVETRILGYNMFTGLISDGAPNTARSLHNWHRVKRLQELE